MNRDEIRAALTGPFASLRTPFDASGAIDYDGFGRLIDFCIDAGSPALMLTYGDSLYSVLTDDEVGEVTRFVVKRATGRSMVIAADRQWATPKAVSFAKYCREIGADLLMVLPPDWGGSCTMESFVDHYAAVAAHVPVMMVTVAFKQRGDAFALKTAALCAERIEGFAAIKDDLCGPFARQLAASVGETVAVVSGGQKENHLDAAPYGVVGYLSTCITFAPQIARDYWQCIDRGDFVGAGAMVKRYDMPFFDCLLKQEGGFDAGMHGIGELAGLCGRWRRKPYYSLTDAQLEHLRASLRDIGLL